MRWDKSLLTLAGREFARQKNRDYNEVIMAEITKEYLDKQLEKLATKTDIRGVKADVQSVKTEVESMKNLVTSEVGKLARMTADGFEEIKNELDVRKEVVNLNRRMMRIEQALNIRN